MHPGKQDPFLSEEALNRIIGHYAQERLLISTAYGDGGKEPLWGRFARAALDQISNQEATFSRYAIWANTVRDNIVEALDLIESGKTDEAKSLLIRAANSMSAFSDVQAYLEGLGLGKRQ